MHVKIRFSDPMAFVGGTNFLVHQRAQARQSPKHALRRDIDVWRFAPPLFLNSIHLVLFDVHGLHNSFLGR